VGNQKPSRNNIVEFLLQIGIAIASQFVGDNRTSAGYLDSRELAKDQARLVCAEENQKKVEEQAKNDKDRRTHRLAVIAVVISVVGLFVAAFFTDVGQSLLRSIGFGSEEISDYIIPTTTEGNEMITQSQEMTTSYSPPKTSRRTTTEKPTTAATTTEPATTTTEDVTTAEEITENSVRQRWKEYWNSRVDEAADRIKM